MSIAAVFDTNVLISASLWPGSVPFQCFSLAADGRVQSITCKPLLQEFSSKLVIKFKRSPQEAQEFADAVAVISRVVEITGSVRDVVRDPTDDKVIECAAVGRATHIVTGDRRHLLPMKQYRGIAIVSPAQFLTLLTHE